MGDLMISRKRDELCSDSRRRSLWLYLRVLGAEANEADDLVQDCFLAGLEGDFEPRSEAETSSYLRETARRLLLSRRRSQQRQEEILREEIAAELWSRYRLDEDEGVEDYLCALRGCLDGLEPQAREAIELSYRDGLAGAELARRLGRSVGALHTLLHRLRALLQGCVRRKIDDER